MMRLKFPIFVAAEHDWTVLVRGAATDESRIESFLRENFSEEEVVIRVSRKIGGLLPIHEAAKLIAEAIGIAEVRVANRAFTEFAVVGHPGVATAWKTASATSTTI